MMSGIGGNEVGVGAAVRRACCWASGSCSCLRMRLTIRLEPFSVPSVGLPDGSSADTVAVFVVTFRKVGRALGIGSAGGSESITGPSPGGKIGCPDRVPGKGGRPSDPTGGTFATFPRVWFAAPTA